MADKAKKESNEAIPSEINEIVSGIAKTLGVAVGELWGIFVRQYFVRGITEAFTSAVLCVAAYCLRNTIHLWILAPLAVALGFAYAAILLLGNPKYYAIEDITDKINDFKVKKKHDSYY